MLWAVTVGESIPGSQDQAEGEAVQQCGGWSDEDRGRRLQCTFDSWRLCGPGGEEVLRQHGDPEV